MLLEPRTSLELKSVAWLDQIVAGDRKAELIIVRLLFLESQAGKEGLAGTAGGKNLVQRREAFRMRDRPENRERVVKLVVRSDLR